MNIQEPLLDPTIATDLAAPLRSDPMVRNTSLEMDAYRLAAIVESADDAIISKTLDSVITSWNKGAERLFGYTPEEAIGQPVFILIPEDHHNEEPGILARLRRGEKIEHYETVRRHKDGRLLDISLTVSPILSADGTVIGASKIARDISERKRWEERLRLALKEAEEAKAQAEEASRLKDEFLSTISHELRTPLTAVMGWVTMLRSSQLTEANIKRALGAIDRNIKSQAQLIEDLLDISRIVNGKMRLDPKPLQLATVIHGAIESVMPAAQAKNIRLQVVLDPTVGSIIGDQDRLQQVIWNLLSNAIKFTPAGGRVQIQLDGSDTGVEISVTDTGIGIEPEFLPFVFDRFSQQDSSSTRNYSGLGMGLSIVKYITELHGGTVAAFSEGNGQGTTMRVKLSTGAMSQQLTLVEPIEVEVTKEVLPECASELSGLKILVVDDEPDTCEMVGVALEQCGAVVKTVNTAAQALDQIEAWHPDILISDINMPHADGYHLIRQIREREAKNQTEAPLPAVALTALARIEDRVKALAVGYHMHVAKPIELHELYSVVSSLASIIVRTDHSIDHR